MNLIEQLKTGTCPFTGKRYDCGRCEKFEKLEFAEPPAGLHISMSFDGYLSDGKRGMKELHKIVGGKKVCTEQECANYYWDLYRLGADTVPVGECDNFCFRRGCMGHHKEKE